MIRSILAFGAAAGLIVVAPMFAALFWEPSPETTANSQIFGYATMIVALSLILVGVKRYRDRVGGGVIKFGPAFLLGLGISAVAGVIYVVGWEIVLRLTDFGFINTYAEGVLAKARDEGASASEIAAMAAKMDAFKAQYADPLFRLPVTFAEIFPVGVVISLASAALLRNSRFLPARRP